MIGQRVHVTAAWRRCARDGVALLDLLVATCVALATLAIVSTALPPVLDVVRAVPEATDLQQRARGTEAVLADLVGSAGAGADLLGEGPLAHAVPALMPRRMLGSADPPGTAWADRLSLRARRGPRRAGAAGRTPCRRAVRPCRSPGTPRAAPIRPVDSVAATWSSCIRALARW